MKKIVFLFLMISIHGSAKDIRSYIYNINNIPLENVQIKNIDSGQEVFSDSLGSFVVSGNETDTILFTLKGFLPTELTIKNIINAQYKIYLFSQLELTLPEVTVMPDNDLYSIYKIAVINLKRKLIRNQDIPYECFGEEKEVNVGDRRSISLLFTAQLQDAKPRKSKIDYQFLLSKLEINSDNKKSDMMKGNNFIIGLFSRNIDKKIAVSDKNQLFVSDSEVIIYDRSDPYETCIYTINKKDTTITKIVYEIAQVKKNYIRRRTFRAKHNFFSISIEYANKGDQYYLSSQTLNFDTSFFTGKPEREERLICTYKTSAIPDTTLNGKVKFKPNTRSLYTMSNLE